MSDEISRSVVNRSIVGIKSYKDLIVWQKSFSLSVKVYDVTKLFPKEEIYGIVSQMRRCAVSVPSNIAEGYTRHKRGEFLQFLQIAFASGAELETQLAISKELRYLSDAKFEEINMVLQEVQKMLNALISKVKNSSGY